MSNYRIFFFLACIASSALLCADAPSSASEIDQQILSLQAQLKELRRDAFNDEMDAQPFMFDNWHEYADEITGNENAEKKITKIKAQIDELNKQKQELLKK